MSVAKIKKFVKADTVRTTLQTDAANEIVDRLNALSDMQSIPADAVSISISDSNTVFTFPVAPVRAVMQIVDPSDGTTKFVLGTIRALGKFQQDPPPDDSGDD